MATSNRIGHRGPSAFKQPPKGSGLAKIAAVLDTPVDLEALIDLSCQFEEESLREEMREAGLDPAMPVAERLLRGALFQHRVQLGMEFRALVARPDRRPGAPPNSAMLDMIALGCWLSEFRRSPQETHYARDLRVAKALGPGVSPEAVKRAVSKQWRRIQIGVSQGGETGGLVAVAFVTLRDLIEPHWLRLSGRPQELPQLSVFHADRPSPPSTH